MNTISGKIIGPATHGVQATLPAPTPVAASPQKIVVDGPKILPELEAPLPPATHPNLPQNFHGFFNETKKDLIAFEGKMTSIPHPNQGQILDLLKKIRSLF